MADYRKKYDLPDDDVVDVCFNMITNCLFCGQDGVSMDFSYCNFIAVDEVAGIMFDDNVFYLGKIDFSYSHIGNRDFSMKGCRFIRCEAVFAHTVFGDKDIY